MTLSPVEALRALVAECTRFDAAEPDEIVVLRDVGRQDGGSALRPNEIVRLSDLRAACEVEKEIATQVYMDDFGVLHLDLHKDDLEPWLGKRLKIVLREVRDA